MAKQTIRIRYNGAVLALETSLANDALRLDVEILLSATEARELVAEIEDALVTCESSSVEVAS